MVLLTLLFPNYFLRKLRIWNLRERLITGMKENNQNL
uniref:Uncharacterized protein n=1 Tax=Arundo donax TaxID=35708 RepID=A0A0A9FFR3_ARUDO